MSKAICNKVVVKRLCYSAACFLEEADTSNPEAVILLSFYTE